MIKNIKSTPIVSTVLKTTLISFFIIFLIVPLATMASLAFQIDITKILLSKQLLSALGNSISIAITATVIVLLMAMPFAFIISRTSIKHKDFFSYWATLPMLIPSISHGMGLVFLLGSNGIITNLLGLKHTIYGFRGIVIGSVLYSFPVALLMLIDILKYEDAAPYEAATILGIPKWRQFISITLPFLAQPLVSVVFATFTLVITDYGVPLILGGQYTTLPLLMYQEVIGRYNYDMGIVIGFVLLFPAIIAFILDMFFKDNKNAPFLIQKFSNKMPKFKKPLYYAYTIGTCILFTVPILAFVFITFVKKYPVNLSFSLDNIKRSIDMGVGKYFRNSLIISGLTSVIGGLIVYVSAYLVTRTQKTLSSFLHFFSILSMSVPGLVLGLSYVLLFKRTGIYNTIVILVIINIVHFFSSPYLLAYNSLKKINDNLEDVGATLGVSKIRIFWNVIVPQTADTIIEVASYFFVNSMMTISAISFLTTSDTMPVALMIPQFEAQMMLEASAFISLLILVSNLGVKAITYLGKRRALQQEEYTSDK